MEQPSSSSHIRVESGDPALVPQVETEMPATSALHQHETTAVDNAAEDAGDMQRGNAPEPAVGHDAAVLEKDAAIVSAAPPPPFTSFTSKEKAFIVFLASLASLLSPMSSTIYYPALDTMASALDVSVSLINLTVTTYLIMQGIAPTFIATWADNGGRRPVYLTVLIISVAANIGLALQTDYAALLVLRLVQASGSSGTIALASGVVGDIAVSSERGKYMGYVSMGALIGPTLAPLIGGILIDFLGWRSVFWFLCIFAGAVLTVILFLLPETCRNVVGNGSIPATGVHMSLLAYLKTRKEPKIEQLDKKKRGWPNPVASILIFNDRGNSIVLMAGSIAVAGAQMINTNLSVQLEARYGFNALQTGLCFIPMGAGTLVATILNGRLLDWNFRRHAKLKGITLVKGHQTGDDFPLEAARLEIMIPYMVLTAASILMYGWVLNYKTNLAGPLIVVFLSGFSFIGVANTTQVMLTDFNLSQPGTAAAAYNLSRGLLAAGGVAAVQPIIDGIGTGWTGTLIAAVCLMAVPLLFLLMKHGHRWRLEKIARQKAASENRS